MQQVRVPALRVCGRTFCPKVQVWCVCASYVERGSSVVECRTRNREIPGSNPPLLPFRRLGLFVLSF